MYLSKKPEIIGIYVVVSDALTKYEVKLYHQQCMIWNEKHFALYAVGHK